MQFYVTKCKLIEETESLQLLKRVDSGGKAGDILKDMDFRVQGIIARKNSSSN